MGQKSTCGFLNKSEDLYQTQSGMTPDLILNPNAIPSRMTIGQLMESICSKYSVLSGEYIDGTPFMEFDMDQVKEKLKNIGKPEDGTEVMYNGQTGESLNAMIFIGPTHFLKLKHESINKVHCYTQNHEILTEIGFVNIKNFVNNHHKMYNNVKIATTASLNSD